MKHLALAVIGISVLVACEEVPSAPLQGDALAEALVTSAMPPDTPALGEQPVSGRTAVDMFTAICLNTAPSFRGAEAVVAANGFAQNPATTTWYHPTLNLSVQVAARCSMVFGSDEEPASLMLALGIVSGAASGGDPIIGVSDAGDEVIAQGPAGTLAVIQTSGGGGRDVPMFHAVLRRP